MGFSLLLRRPALRRLWLSSTISLVGDWLSFVAVSLLAVERGGGVLALAGVLAVHALPHALLAPVAGPIADRFDRRRLLLAANVAQAALTLLMAAAALRGAVLLVQVIVLARGAVSAFVVPAETAALRRVVPPEELQDANTLLSTTWSVTYVAGMAAGGLLAALGPSIAMVLDAGSFALAALLLLPLPAMAPEVARDASLRRALAAAPSDLAEALRFARGRPELFRALLSKAPVAMAGGAGFIVLNLVAKEHAPFGVAAVSLGLMQAIRGAGTGLGPMITSALVRRGRSSASLGVLAIAVTFAAIAAFAIAPPGVALLGLALVWGMGSGANWVLSSADLQRLAPDAFIGRLAAVDDLGAMLGMIAGGLAGAAIAEAAGSASLAAFGGLALAAAASAWLFRATGSAQERDLAPAAAS